MPRLPPGYRDVLADHRARLARVSEGAGLRNLERLYLRAQGELEVKLRRLTREGRKDVFTATQARGLLAQARQGQLQISQMLAGGTAELSEKAQTEALKGLERDIARLERSHADQIALMRQSAEINLAAAKMAACISAKPQDRGFTNCSAT